MAQGPVLADPGQPGGERLGQQQVVAREAVREIDGPENPIKVVVSVLMLREGWDVRGVTVVLGLRPFSASAMRTRYDADERK